MKPSSLAFFLVFCSLGQAYGQSQFQQNMYEIYKSSYSEEVSDELWADYVRGLRNRTYTVSEGDTLWDLSLIFFGDGNYWSKIWSYNESLINPHFIAVGQEIAFFSGSLDQPPEVFIKGQDKKEQDGEEAKPEGFDEFDLVDISEDQAAKPESPKQKVSSERGQLYPGAPGIPPPRDAIRPPLEELPESFADFDGFKVEKYDIQGISLDLRPPVQVNPLFVAQSFLYSRAPSTYPHIGRIVESERGNTYLGLNDEVYIEMKEKVDIGEELTILNKDYRFDRNGVNGYVIRYSARVRIHKQVKENLYLGEIFYSLSGVHPGAWVSREAIPSMDDDHSGRPSDLELDIVGGGIDNTSKIYGDGDIIYLRGGSEQGLRNGDILGVYKNRRARYRETRIERSPRPIGHIKVFRAGKTLSSAFVVSSIDEIIPGDKTGSPSQVSGLAVESEREDLGEIELGLESQSESEIR